MNTQSIRSSRYEEAMRFLDAAESAGVLSTTTWEILRRSTSQDGTTMVPVNMPGVYWRLKKFSKTYVSDKIKENQ